MKILFSLFFLFPFANLFAQKTLGFDTTILAVKEKEFYGPRSIKIDSENNKFVSGIFKGTITLDTFTISTSNLINNSTSSNAGGVFIVKYDSLNNLQWLKKIAESDSLFDINITIDHSNYLIVNYLFLSKLYLENDSIINNGSNNISIVKYDSDGNLLYFKKTNGGGQEGIPKNGTSVDSQNNIYACGNFGTPGFTNYQLILGTDTLNSLGVDPFILKTDSAGNIVDAFQFGGLGIDVFGNIVYDNSYLYVLGTTNFNNVTLNNLVLNFNPNYYSYCFLAKIDTNGNTIWARGFGSQDNQSSGVIPRSLAVKNNRVYITGGAFSNGQNSFSFDNGPTLYGSDQVDYFIAAYDTAGNFKWNTISKSNGDEAIIELAIDNHDNLIGVGYFDYKLKFPTDTLYSNGGYDALLCSYDSMGNFLWGISGGGMNGEITRGIALDSYGKIHIVGATTSYPCYMGNDTLYPPSGQSTIFYASIDSIDYHAPDGDHDYSLHDNLFQIYPNPANTSIGIKVNDVLNNHNNIIIKNILGQIVLSEKINTQNYILNTSYLNDGIYFVTYKNAKFSTTKKLIIKH